MAEPSTGHHPPRSDPGPPRPDPGLPEISVRIDTPTHLSGDSDAADVCAVLSRGTVHQLGRIPEASNDTRLITVSDADTVLRAVYKPSRGARPLRDFHYQTLAAREVACFELGRVLGLPVAPPTVMRTDLPGGPGSVQAYVESLSPGEDLVDIFEPDEVPSEWAAIFQAVSEDGEDLIVAHAPAPALRQIALFDLIVNNADRKASHILSGHYRFDGAPPAVFGIDHGLTFHTSPKLRTVLWGFAGEPLYREELTILSALCDGDEAAAVLRSRLTDAEAEATLRRGRALMQMGTFPQPPERRMPIPWPPL